ncbi:MAG TPA: extracellular solute-binding protein [Niallia sp.]|nr:extracellular solute-binding protein [Niallia sp.]
MKKFLALMLVGILILSGCSSGAGSSGSSDKDANEITLWAWDPNFNIKAVELAKEAYKQENADLNVKVIEYAQADVIQKLNTSLSSGSTKGLPNIVLIEDYRAQGFLKAYPDMFFELTDYMKSEDFASYKIAPTSLDGKNYGIPFDTGVGGLYVRTDYLEEAGYSIDDLVGMDWDKYIEIGKQVKAKTGKHMLTQDPKDLALIRMMIQSAGSWYMKEDGATPNIVGNEALKEAFLTYKKILDADIVKPVSDWSQFVAGFNSGDVASVPTGNWITPSVKAEASQSGKWTVANFPKLAGVPNSVNASNLGGSSWYVLNIDGKEKAAEFLGKTFGSNVDFYQTLVKEIGAIGTYIPASQSEAYQLSDEFFNGQAIVQDFAKWTEQIPQINYGLHTYAIDDILAIGMQDYIKGKDLDEVLNNAQKQAEEQIK